jgi:HAE1 family hydrophobic/amphiphilic exporter-1
MVSLLVSFTLTPMLCSRFLKPSKKSKETKETWLFRIFDVPYKSMLRWSMAHRWAIVLCSVLVFLSTIPLFMIIGKDFLPTDDQSEFEVTVRMPPGSSLEGSDAVMKGLEAELKTLPGVKNMLTTLGADEQKQVDRGSILMELVPFDKRKESQDQLMLMARQRLKKFHDLVLVAIAVSGRRTTTRFSVLSARTGSEPTGQVRHRSEETTGANPQRYRYRQLIRSGQAGVAREDQSR